MSFQGAMESVTDDQHKDILKVEVVDASWTFVYSNGYVVNLRGALTAWVRFLPFDPTRPPQAQLAGHGMMKIQQLQFDAERQEKYLALDAILGTRIPESPNLAVEGDDDRRYDDPRYIIANASIPVEPVNAFGIPQATMRCLEVRATLMCTLTLLLIQTAP